MKKAEFKIARSSNNLGTFKDAEMDWFFRRTLEYVNCGGADKCQSGDIWLDELFK